MSDIELTELSKSKEFIKHAKIADGLTKETGLEHGFTFCKPKDKIIVDKMCVGDKCNISIGVEKCEEFNHTVHTHPNQFIPDLSVSDIVMSLYASFDSGKPNISCVKTTNNKNILCEKRDMKQDEKKMNVLSQIEQYYFADPNIERTVVSKNALFDLVLPKHIIFKVE